MRRAGSISFVGLLVAVALWTTPELGRTHEPNVVEKIATGSFERVSTAIRDGLKARKMAIIRQIHFHDMLAAVAVESEKAITYETFHPRFGKVVYANDKQAFIELPLRIHVRETDAGVQIRYRQPSDIFAPYRGLGDMAHELDQMFEDVANEAAQ